MSDQEYISQGQGLERLTSELVGEHYQPWVTNIKQKILE